MLLKKENVKYVLLFCRDELEIEANLVEEQEYGDSSPCEDYDNLF